MAAKLKLIPGSTIRWGARRFVVVDYVGLDAVIAREVGKRKLERIPVRVANPVSDPWRPGGVDSRSRLHTGRGLGGSCEAIQEPQALAGNGPH
jgi:hypothetical protein